MRMTFPRRISWLAVLLLVTSSLALAAEQRYKPYVLGSESQADYAETVQSTRNSLAAAGFQVIGEYVPYADATVLMFTDADLQRVATQSKYGGFAAVQRASVVKRGDKVQVAYTNPVYMAYAYRLKGNLQEVADRLSKALGNQTTFGAKRGLYPEDLEEYHYTFGMEYFDEPYELASYSSHDAAVAAVAKNLDTNNAGVRPLYRLDLPGKPVTVFGVSMKAADANGDGKYMDDKFQMGVVDNGPYSQVAYLPYEIMVTGNKVVALHMRFRMAVNFPSLRMMGSNSFMTLMPSPDAIQKALTLAVGGKPESDEF